MKTEDRGKDKGTVLCLSAADKHKENAALRVQKSRGSSPLPS